MFRRSTFIVSIAALACLATSVFAASAEAQPIWNLELHHLPTRFEPDGKGELMLTIANVGNEPTSGPVGVTVTLPEGLTGDSTMEEAGFWSCPGAAGASVIECTTEAAFPRRATTLGLPNLSSPLVATVDVAPSAGGQTLTATAGIDGGGATAAAGAFEEIEVGPTPATFGIVPGSFSAGFFGEDAATPVLESGAHPDLATFSFDFNTVPHPEELALAQSSPAADVRDLEVQLPPGFIGNPSAVAECDPNELVLNQCPPASQVGRIDVALATPLEHIPDRYLGLSTVGVYNMTHPRGSVTDLAFSVVENIIHIKASLNPADHYAIRTVVPQINQFLPVYFQKLTLWGVPAAASHNFERSYNRERCRQFEGVTEETVENEFGFVEHVPISCSTNTPVKPFLTVPSQCGAGNTITLKNYDSWQNPGVFGPEIPAPGAGAATNCDRPRFEPELEAQATGVEASSPAGLEVTLRVPQNENPNGLASPPVKSVKVSLPGGMSLSPSFANGLAGCSEAQFGITGASFAAVPDEAGVACPDSSRIGVVSIQTPLLKKPLEGSLYLAQQGANPFSSTFAVYLAAHDTEERGVLLKIPGKIEVDPTSGQITTTFDELPEFPFSEFSLAFRSGQRAPLVNPSSCGPHAITAQIASYALPTAPLQISSSYAVSTGANGSPCPATPASNPFSPKLEAGTANSNAAGYSPFSFRLTRGDQEQQFGRITATLPPGLTAKIAGIPYCADAVIASISEAEGTGRAQLEHPSCPAVSRIGHALTGVGAGTEPKFFEGSVYLAGPYKGDPLSLAVVVPALAGPYDLGSVVVRAGIHVDPTTAQVKVESDPLPTIVHGIPLRIRDVRVDIDRPEGTLNPTNCNPFAVNSHILSTLGAVSTPSSRFQSVNCASLAFGPKLALKLTGPTQRGKDPALRAVLTQAKGQANIGRVSVVLPKSEFIDSRHVNNPCTRVQFNAGGGNGERCPAKAILGYAKAFTPLLETPLEGPVYFRSNGGERKLPDLVAALHGQFNIDLVGFIDSVRAKGSETSRVRNTFATVPDAPVTKFILNLKGGKKGLLQNSANLCKVKNFAQIKMTGQNGMPHDFAKSLANECASKKSKGVKSGGGKKH